ncbi:hypothetical protein TWF225_008030 [Orbilia oligospora]|uniref:Uncharacterized protein n=1 Tax=Orbilia oligospora TaxID=2813651 RepID=A0A7C8KPI4_ORBOL|nr:hypothetical protein TWF751_006945 [Orbilia oligospora]KAF3177750.1 hypothetical protein TWF225_008030 [Orbilia oligospora]KAF3239845.1 hypothetical protein TWF217_001167 [Orbilia oligospora]KAF3260086.1 hypothetical protein TWF128_003568 [Orbilia oligospora]KAF3280301.1 hypothetical protein TWF132_011860 [Orbilia oligospora]
MHIQNIKSALVALVAFNALAASAVPAQEQELEQRDPYGYGCPTKTVTKWSTKWATKYSTKYGYAVTKTKTVTKTNSKCTKTATKTVTKYATRTATKTATKTITKTNHSTKTAFVISTGLPFNVKNRVITIAAPRITAGGKVTNLQASIITIPGTSLRGLGGNVLDIGATHIVVAGSTVKVGPVITLPEAVITVAGETRVIAGGCLPDYTTTVNSGTVTVTESGATATNTKTVTETNTSVSTELSTVVSTSISTSVSTEVSTSTIISTTVSTSVSISTSVSTSISISVSVVPAEPKFTPGPRIVGCYKDENANMNTDAPPETNNVMTPTLCNDYCFGQVGNSDIVAAGLIGGDTCMCAKQWKNNPHPSDFGGCKKPCTGDASGLELCGGDGYIQQTVSAPSPRLFGCYKKSGTEDILEVIKNISSVTPENCRAACYVDGYVFSGLTNGNTCSCGNYFKNAPAAYDPADNSQCLAQCSGNSILTCGGSGDSGYTDIYVWTG